MFLDIYSFFIMRNSIRLILLTVMLSLTSNAQSQLRPCGDVNCDWEVNIADLNSLIDNILNETRYHAFYTYALDLNGDKEINIADVNILVDGVFGAELPPMPSYSGTLPVLYINTEGTRNIDSKEEYVHADWWLDNMGLEGYEPLGSRKEPLGMLIRGRGNYTWIHVDKKSFRVKLDKKQPLMGMKKNRHFCLLAGDYWTNPVGFELSRRIGLAYTPAQAPVEVVLNGQYIGLYFITEKIRVEKDRVNVSEQINGEEDADMVTGGWLIEIDGHPEENQFAVREGNGNLLGVVYHIPDSLSTAQRDYLYNLITQTDRAVYDSINCGAWEKYIDIDTLACFYIVNEVADDIESFTGSLFLHKHRGDSTKLLFGPVWDFGCSFGRPLQEEPCFLYENTDKMYTPHWLLKMVESLDFQEAVRRHWEEFYPSLETMEAYIDSVVARIASAYEADMARWPNVDPWWASIVLKSKYYYKPHLRDKIQFLKDQWSQNIGGNKE